MSWADMKGDEQVRYCSGCRLHVYNLSAMDVEDAARLIFESSDRLCVRLYRRQDGTVLTQDCPVGLRAAIRRRVAAFAGSLAAGIGVLSGLLLRPAPRTAATLTTPPAPTAPSGLEMGDMAPAPPLIDRPNPFGEMVGECAFPILNNPPVARMGRMVAQPRAATGVAKRSE
jgi:hypothetical protein